MCRCARLARAAPDARNDVHNSMSTHGLTKPLKVAYNKVYNFVHICARSLALRSPRTGPSHSPNARRRLPGGDCRSRAPRRHGSPGAGGGSSQGKGWVGPGEG
eukprot:scaffold5822_cov255-Prasinococcus_capsulatus_cf.AAC.1